MGIKNTVLAICLVFIESSPIFAADNNQAKEFLKLYHGKLPQELQAEVGAFVNSNAEYPHLIEEFKKPLFTFLQKDKPVTSIVWTTDNCLFWVDGEDYLRMAFVDEAYVLPAPKNGVFYYGGLRVSSLATGEIPGNKQVVAIGYNGGTVKIFNPETLDNILRLKGSPFGYTVCVIRISPQGQYVIAGLGMESIGIWDLKSPDLRRLIIREHHRIVRALSCNPEGTLFAAGSEGGTLKIIKTATGAVDKTLQDNGDAIWSVSWHPKNTTLAVADAAGHIKLWNIQEDIPTSRVLYIHPVESKGCCFSPNGQYLAASFVDGTIIIWETNTWSIATTLKSNLPTIYCLSWSPSGTRIAAGSQEGLVSAWDINMLLQAPVLLQNVSRVMGDLLRMMDMDLRNGSSSITPTQFDFFLRELQGEEKTHLALLKEPLMKFIFRENIQRALDICKTYAVLNTCLASLKTFGARFSLCKNPPYYEEYNKPVRKLAHEEIERALKILENHRATTEHALSFRDKELYNAETREILENMVTIINTRIITLEQELLARPLL